MSDVRVLVITDVVGSTEMTERIGDAAMAAVWAAHDRIARDLLPRFGGREIDKTDGMLLMFDRVADAVAYAFAYHEGLTRLPAGLRARAGLHVGPVVLRENAPEDVARGAKPLEVDGIAKPTVARVMSIAVGGQTLLTPEAKEALGETAWRTESHGHWYLKGVGEPVELFEVGTAETRFSMPPDAEKAYQVVRVGQNWVPVRQIPNNLPTQSTSFIGRERERNELRALLGKIRLVTLLGMGGLGKTRLSLQVATELLGQFPDGVWFLDLAPIRDAALGANAIEKIANEASMTRATALLGIYDFAGDQRRYGQLMQGWLRAAPAGSIIMCHPAQATEPDDPIGVARAEEFAYLSGPDFAQALAQAGVQLVRGVTFGGR